MGLIEAVNKLTHPSILVIGDLVLDRYVWGRVNRISPEAPIQILNITNPEDHRLGGAANVAHNLVTLGARVTCFGAVGNDEAGRKLLSELRKVKINTTGIVVDRSRTTPVKTRFLDNGHKQQVLRVDEENPRSLSPTAERELLYRLKPALKGVDLVIASDYLKGTFTHSLMREIIRLARVAGKPLIIGPKGTDYQEYTGATGLVLNRAEAGAMTGLNLKDKAGWEQAGRWLVKNLRLSFAAITLGEEGIYLAAQTGEKIHQQAHPRAVYDVTGAGDTVLAMLGLALASGLPYQESLHLANLAAGVVVGKVGTATVTRSELIEHSPSADGWNKIKTLPELRTIVGNRFGAVVFTNGCFDILHPGHIKSLTWARAQGDMLVVGLNSDKSVRAIKGKGRPIFSQQLRARSLAELACVDYVIIFNESTPINLIKTIKPDILVKGADWRGKPVVGEGVVKSRGGQVLFAPLEPGISTTGVIKRLS